MSGITLNITHGPLSEIDKAAKAYEAAREHFARAAVCEMVLLLKRKGAPIFDEKALERATERIVEAMLAEGWV